MDAITALWHVFGFVATPVLAGLIAGASARLLWRGRPDRPAHPTWRRSLGWPIGAAVAAQALGLVVFGQDGRTATYAGVVVAIAAALGWAMSRGSA